MNLSVLTVIFAGAPELAGFIGATDDGVGGDNWSYKSCKAPFAPVKSSPPTLKTVYRPDTPPAVQPTAPSTNKNEAQVHILLQGLGCAHV